MKPHLFLNNPSGENKKFSAGRNIDTDKVSEKPAQNYKHQKLSLRNALTRLNQNREIRVSQRTLRVPEHLEFIRVDFFIVFNNNQPTKTKSRFKNQFGLIPVVYSQFNQSVLFAITDEAKFQDFIKLLQDFINSSDSKHPLETSYAITTLIYDFEFLSTIELMGNSTEKDVILSFVRNDENISLAFNKIYGALINHVKRIQNDNNKFSYETDGISTIEIKGITTLELRTIAANFDIIYKIHSLRVPTIKPDTFGVPGLTWDFSINAPIDNKIIIAVIDNGVRAIPPLEKILLDNTLDITSKTKPNSHSAQHPHGTIVSSLAAVGLNFFDVSKKNFQADAYILPIKILNFDKGCFNIYDIKNAIDNAIRRGVRIFNLSVCGSGKMYNSIVSEYAYMLDKIAYENDILIFIATGNLSHEDIEAMQANPPKGKNKDFHKYPNHFYNPYKQSDYHVCEASNICLPSESYNNITVGAIADNLIENSKPDISSLKELPAVYTLKSHVDYSKKINGTYFNRKQTNYNINKPDIVMPGGDLLKSNSAMQVLGFGSSGTDFFIRDAGTSYATPLAANLAAKIIGLYPSLNMQSIKALIINNSKRLLVSEFLNDLIFEIKDEASNERFKKKYTDLEPNESKIINEVFNSDDLYRRLVGYGVPQISNTLYSDSKSVTIMIQDSISVDSHKVINLNIPEYLLKYDKPSYILSLKATLCYKFLPVWNNQLGYNPLHISFNFLNSIVKDNPGEIASIIADKDHEFYAGLTKTNATPEEKAKAKKKALGIKTNLTSWSEDFFPPATKPFANTQQLDLNIKKEEIRKVNNQLSIAIRCTYKKDLDKDIVKTLLHSLHEFSIVLNVSEKANTKLKDYDLYDELIACNELDVISKIELEDLEL